MATIQNDRDVLLQAAAVRFVLPIIDPGQVPGYEDALQDISDLQGAVGNLLNTSSSFAIRASSMTFIGASGATSPTAITLTAVRGSGLTGGTVAWTVFAGSATLSAATGDTTSITGSTVTGASVTVRARLTIGSNIHDAYVTITRLGAISAVDQVSLASQVTGQLANGNVSGLGALALLNTVNLNSQVVGALNGLTQVTNLGNLAYANGIAANQIGAGTLAAGVIYAGTINADRVNGGSFSGKLFAGGTFTGSIFRTAASGRRIEISGSAINFYPSSGNPVEIEPSSASSQGVRILTPSGSYGTMLAHNGIGAAVSVVTGSGPGIRLTMSGHPALAIDETSSLPASRTAGNVCFYQGWLCFANGSHWFKSNGEQLT